MQFKLEFKLFMSEKQSDYSLHVDADSGAHKSCATFENTWGCEGSDIGSQVYPSAEDMKTNIQSVPLK